MSFNFTWKRTLVLILLLALLYPLGGLSALADGAGRSRSDSGDTGVIVYVMGAVFATVAHFESSIFLPIRDRPVLITIGILAMLAGVMLIGFAPLEQEFRHSLWPFPPG